jgi:amino acid transporter
MASKQVFLRDATGLVRSFSWFDAFLISSSVVLPSLWSVASQIAFVATADPGADWVMSEHLGFLFTLPLSIAYVMLATSMPRAGGDYVWISRAGHRVVGFICGWSFWITLAATAGIEGYINSTVVLPIALVTLGYGSANPSLVSLAATVAAPIPAFVLGLVLIIAAALIAGLGARVFSRVMTILFILIMLGAFVSFYVFGTSTHADFVNAVAGYGGTNMTYNGIITQAQATGWSYVPLALGATLTSIPLSVLLYNGQNFSAAAAGEVKNVRSSMWYAIPGSLVFAWLFNIVGTQLAVNVVGYQFVQAAFAVGSSWPLPAPPWMPLFVSMLTHNFVLLCLIQLGWLLTFLWNIPGFLLVATRYVFAFSFDRVFPGRFADINDRFHFPLKAMALNTVCATIFLILATFTSYLGIFLNSVAIWSIVWLLGSAVAVILPYKKKELAASLPGSKWKIPLVTLVGAIAMVFMAASFYFSVTTPAIGPSTPGADAILLTIFVVGLLVYFVSNSLNKKKGIDMKLAFAQIPPE